MIVILFLLFCVFYVFYFVSFCLFFNLFIYFFQFVFALFCCFVLITLVRIARSCWNNLNREICRVMKHLNKNASWLWHKGMTTTARLHGLSTQRQYVREMPRHKLDFLQNKCIARRNPALKSQLNHFAGLAFTSFLIYSSCPRRPLRRRNTRCKTPQACCATWANLLRDKMWVWWKTSSKTKICY